MLMMNLSQMRAFEPGDAEWGVKLEDVRGQAEAKEEVRRVVSIWQSGEAFERAGGKRERGLLFLGAPGTGKTMLAKALATGFNSPFVSMPAPASPRPSSASTRSSCACSHEGEEARAQVGRPVHRLHRRDRRRRHAPAGAAAAVGARRRPVLVARRQRLLVLRPVGRAEPVRRPDRGDRAAGASGCSSSARRPLDEPDREPDRQPVPRRDARRHGRRWAAGAQPAARRDGRHRQPAASAPRPDEPHQHAARRLLPRAAPHRQGAAADSARASSRRADLLHRRNERPDGPARPGAHAPGPDGTARLVPHADEGRPQGRLRPLPRQGGARARARHAAAPRRDRADHERLLARDDRPGLLDGAHERPARGEDLVRLGAPRRRR